MAVIYQLDSPLTGAFVDVSSCLQDFVQGKTLAMEAVFQTDSVGFDCFFSVLYKESVLPDFGIYLHRGYPSVVTRQGGRQILFTGKTAYNDNKPHTLHFYGGEEGIALWVDGEEAFADTTVLPYCDYHYVGFAFLGRSTLVNQWDNLFTGTISSLILQEEAFPLGKPEEHLKKIPLFYRGLAGYENFRIPALLTTKEGVVIATADGRKEVAGDNPNHITRVVRRSLDGGDTWTEPEEILDFGGYGREEGASAIDGVLFQCGKTSRVFLAYGHTPSGVGSVNSVGAVGFDNKGRKELKSPSGAGFYVEDSGEIVTAEGKNTGDRVDALGRLSCGGSVCHGSAPYRELPTTYLQYCYSDDQGETWSKPIEMNPMVKEEWMGFLGPGPGCGIDILYGDYKGRLVFPVYYKNVQTNLYSCAVVYSDDQGEQWKRGQAVSQGRLIQGVPFDHETTTDPFATTSEAQVVELEDGVLKIFMRSTYGGRIATALSHTGGETWENFVWEDGFVDPSCQCSALRGQEEGKPFWLFSNPSHPDLRVQGRIYRSEDGTKTWTSNELLESGDFAYSCLCQLPQGEIGILYEGLDLTQYFAKIPLDWVK